MSSNGDPKHDKNGSWISINEVAHERELRESEMARIEDSVSHLRELYADHRESVSKALTLQATEYERRLEMLNHEHARAAEALRLTVSRETFDNYRGEMDKWKIATTELLAEQRGAQAQETLSNQRRLALLGLGLTILALVLRFFIQ